MVNFTFHPFWLDTLSQLQHGKWSLGTEYCSSWVEATDQGLGLGMRQLELEEVGSRVELEENKLQKLAWDFHLGFYPNPKLYMWRTERKAWKKPLLGMGREQTRGVLTAGEKRLSLSVPSSTIYYVCGSKQVIPTLWACFLICKTGIAVSNLMVLQILNEIIIPSIHNIITQK